MNSKVGCYDCGLEYGGDSWIEAIVPDEVWLQISPTGNDSGILCISCIARRCRELGIETHVTLCGTEPLHTECDPKNCPQEYPKKIARIRAESIKYYEALQSMKKEEFPKITTVDEAISAALDEGFMSMKGARLMAREIEDLRALLCRASRIMSGGATSPVKAEELWRKDLNGKELE